MILNKPSHWKRLVALILTAQSASAAIAIYVSPPGDVSSSMENTEVEDFKNAPETWGDGTSFTSENIGTYTQITGTVETLGQGKGERYGIDDSEYLAISPFSTLELELANDFSYFGFAWPAGDANNRITIYSGDTILFTLETSDVVDFLPDTNSSTITSIDGGVYNTQDYYGQPDTDKNEGEPYAYIHIIANAGDTFDNIVFEHPRSSGKFETDNHAIIQPNYTVEPKGDYVLLFDDAVAQIPEPSVYALMIGFASLAMTLGRRHRSLRN
ncbi:Npun_F0296 family exosortase-dependent surface protein [Coraliomargarita sp. W4R72]